MTTVRSWKRILGTGLVVVVGIPLITVPLLVLAVVQGPPLPVTVDAEIDSGVERIKFSGQIDISTRIIDDPDFNGPTMLEMIIDFKSVKGVGKASGRKFATESQTVIHRPLLAFDEIEATFPYTQGNDVHAARTAKAAISVAFSPGSGLRVTSRLTSVKSDREP